MCGSSWLGQAPARAIHQFLTYLCPSGATAAVLRCFSPVCDRFVWVMASPDVPIASPLDQPSHISPQPFLNFEFKSFFITVFTSQHMHSQIYILFFWFTIVIGNQNSNPIAICILCVECKNNWNSLVWLQRKKYYSFLVSGLRSF